jgi:hypothetical protein
MSLAQRKQKRRKGFLDELIKKAIDEFRDRYDNEQTALAKCAAHLKLLQDMLEQTVVNQNLAQSERDDLTLLVISGLEKCRQNILQLNAQSSN